MWCDPRIAAGTLVCLVEILAVAGSALVAAATPQPTSPQSTTPSPHYILQHRQEDAEGRSREERSSLGEVGGEKSKSYRGAGGGNGGIVGGSYGDYDAFRREEPVETLAGIPVLLPRQRFGGSSSPVDPIKPLLDLGMDGSGNSSSVPPHPVFDEAAPRNVTGLKGTAAYLHCLVHNLGNKSVSWIRQRDLHILTVGRYTYTTDQRYEVIHAEGSKDWILKIKYAQVRDSANYECQVSTKPVMAYVIRLNVFAAPKAEIIGFPDMHVDKGSTINLTCIIANSSEPPHVIAWFHNSKEVSYDSPRGGITIVTERGNSTTGYLLIQDARPSDTGNYSCVPTNTASATVRVHVLNGETPAAMQTNGSPPSSWYPLALPFLLLPLLQSLGAAVHQARGR